MFEKLPGFRDFYPEDCAVRNYIFQRWREAARRFGFSEYDAPTLEPLDLFTAKSGEEIVTQLFNFTDKGDRPVTLRPEMTPSLARLVGAKANSLKRPVKWCSIGEMFRYEKPQKGRLRSHYQFNADILGESDPAADAEIIALILHTFASFGLTADDIVLRLSDRQLWLLYLGGAGLSDEQAPALLSIIDKMEREERQKTLEKLKLYTKAPENFLSQVQKLAALRSIDEVQSFLREHVQEPARQAQLEKRLTEWQALLGHLEAMQLTPFVRLDLGIVRGLAYYTGFVFEVFEKGGQGRALSGGGRYDHLLKKLGYPDMPAVGFGLGDVTLTDILEEKKLLPAAAEKVVIYAIIGGLAERPAALADLMKLRQQGYSVEYPLKETGFGKQFKLADASGAKLALIYGSTELAANSVKIRDLKSGVETLVPRDELFPAIANQLGASPTR